MQYLCFVCNPVEENTYLIWDETTLEAAIIDAGMWSDSEWQRIEREIKEKGLHLRYALQTHTHFDHIFGLRYIYDRYGFGPTCHVDDAETYKSQPSFTRSFGLQLPMPLPPIEHCLKDGDTIQLGETTLRVIHTPGHTPGGICLYAEKDKLLFSGDTLFRGGIGRTDFEGGSYETEIHSLRTLLTLPDDVTALSGHGPRTTIGWEKTNNPYV